MDVLSSTNPSLQEVEPKTLADDIIHPEDQLDSRLQAIRKNPRAFAWCLFTAWTILLATYEDQASYAVLGIPEFRKDFGSRYGGDYVIEASWQSAFQGGPIASRIVGALTAAPIADYLGRRNALIIALVLSLVGITLEVVATTNAVFFGGKLLSGMAVAAMESVSGTYLAEIVPLALRGLMTVLIPFAASLGSLTVAFILNSTGTLMNRWAYRAVFCSQYGCAAIIVVLVWFMPESPWWLLSKGHEDKALKSLNRLGYMKATGDDTRHLARIRATLEEIRCETKGASYLECFRNSNLRRTIVAIGPLSVQIWIGVIFIGMYSTYYTQLAGYSPSMSFKLLIVQQIISLVGNMMSWYLIDRAGRRNLTVYGTLASCIILCVMGGLAVGGSQSQLRGTVAMILVYIWVSGVTIGATSYTYLTEVATARLRAKTISIGIALQSCFGVMWSFILPYLFNPDEANLGGKLGFIFGAMGIPCFIFLWRYQPETAGRSYEELDEMFLKEVPAREFKRFQTQRASKRQQETHSRDPISEAREV